MQGSLVWGQIGYYALQERNVTSEIVSGLDAKWSHVQYNLHMSKRKDLACGLLHRISLSLRTRDRDP